MGRVVPKPLLHSALRGAPQHTSHRLQYPDHAACYAGDGVIDDRTAARTGLFENVTMETVQPAAEPLWQAFKDEELFALRICDLRCSDRTRWPLCLRVRTGTRRS